MNTFQKRLSWGGLDWIQVETRGHSGRLRRNWGSRGVMFRG